MTTPVGFWLITKNPDDIDIEVFRPPGACFECAVGNEAAHQYIITNPTRYLALGNLTYRALWIRGTHHDRAEEPSPPPEFFTIED